MTEKPSKSEEEYFARKEAELREARRMAAASAARDAERKSHYMKCPKCGANLTVEEYHGVEIDRCPDCKGIWFDAGEAELLIEKETAGFGKIFASVVKGVRGRAPAGG
jgi:uncharacterized protein